MLKQSIASQHSRALYNKILDNTGILIYIYTAYMNNTHPISTTTEWISKMWGDSGRLDWSDDLNLNKEI